MVEDNDQGSKEVMTERERDKRWDWMKWRLQNSDPTTGSLRGRRGNDGDKPVIS